MKRFFSFLLVVVLMSCTAYGAFDQSRFDADANQYGNKSANLRELERLVTALNATQPNAFAIPAIFPISHDAVYAYLAGVPSRADSSKTVVASIEQQWQAFQKNLKRGDTTLSAEQQKILKAIRSAINDAFSKDFPLSDNLILFLNEAVAKKQLLMVRSTGREDTKELANAGGNESITSVDPKITAVSQAIIQVVASYFSEKSIKQRLVGNDPDLFAGKPFMPVLLQVMIGEPMGGALNKNGVPVSGVMFSQEAEGRTAGVTHIEATWGHNEGVVNGLVAVDTYYVGPVGVIHPLVRIKPERLVTNAVGTALVPMRNTFAGMEKEPCLSKELVKALKRGADVIQKHYGNYPQDIEFVVMNGVVNLVQTRPTVHKDTQPSYLNEVYVATRDASKRQEVYTIVAGGGTAYVITHPDQLIITDNLRAGLETFLDTKNKDQIKAVVSGDKAPTMSHEANTFRGAAKPVVYVRDTSIIKQWVADGKVAIVDPQRGLVVLFEPSGQFTDSGSTLVQDWLVHPIPKKVSLFAEFMPQLSGDDAAQIKPQEFNKAAKTTELLRIIRDTTDAQKAMQAVRSILHRVSASIVRHKDNRQLSAQLKNIFAHMIGAAHEIRMSLSKPQRLDRLYPFVFFEALLRQVPLRDEFINDYSFLALVKTEQQETKIKTEIGQQGMGPIKQAIVQYAKAQEHALTPVVQNKWRDFVKGIPIIKDMALQAKFSQLIHTVAQLDMMPLWMNLSFGNIDVGTPEETMQALVAEYEQSTAIIAYVQNLKQKIAGLNIAGWENPNTFNKQWDGFKKGLIDLFVMFNFIKQFQAAPQLGKSAALTVMQSFVTAFDTSIKTLTSSRAYPADNKVKITNFKTMLDGYFQLLSNWAGMQIIESEMRNQLDERTFKSLNVYLDEISSIMDDAMRMQNTLQAGSMDVAAAALGSKALWERAAGKQITLEDSFSLIHQNLLIVLAILNKKNGMDKLEVPGNVEYLKTRFSQINYHISGGDGHTAQLIGVAFEGDVISYMYNLSMRNHSNTFEIRYNHGTKKTTLQVTLLGREDQQRYYIAFFGIRLMEQLSGIQQAAPLFVSEKSKPTGTFIVTKLTWYIQGPGQASLAGDFVQLVVNLLTDVGLKSWTQQDLFKKMIASQDAESLLQIFKTIFDERLKDDKYASYAKRFFVQEIAGISSLLNVNTFFITYEWAKKHILPYHPRIMDKLVQKIEQVDSNNTHFFSRYAQEARQLLNDKSGSSVGLTMFKMLDQHNKISTTEVKDLFVLLSQQEDIQETTYDMAVTVLNKYPTLTQEETEKIIKVVQTEHLDLNDLKNLIKKGKHVSLVMDIFKQIEIITWDAEEDEWDGVANIPSIVRAVKALLSNEDLPFALDQRQQFADQFIDVLDTWQQKYAHTPLKKVAPRHKKSMQEARDKLSEK